MAVKKLTEADIMNTVFILNLLKNCKRSVVLTAVSRVNVGNAVINTFNIRCKLWACENSVAVCYMLKLIVGGKKAIRHSVTDSL